MKIKHLILISLIIMFVLSVTAVSASDNNDNLTVNDNADDEISYTTNNSDVSYAEEDNNDGESSSNVLGALNSNYRFSIDGSYDDDDRKPYADESVIYFAYLPSDANGNLIITANGVQYTGKVDKGVYRFAFNELQSGQNNFTFTYEDSKYAKKTITKTLHAYPRIIVPSKLHYDSDEEISLILSPNAKGNLTVYAAAWDDFNKKYIPTNIIKTVPFTSRIATIKSSELPFGNYSVIIGYSSDDYNVPSVNKTIIIGPKVTYNEHMCKYEPNNITIGFPNGITGNLTVILHPTSRVDYGSDDDLPTINSTLDSDILLYNSTINMLALTLNVPVSIMNNSYWNIKIKFANETSSLEQENSFILRKDPRDWNVTATFPELNVNDYSKYWHVLRIPYEMTSANVTLYIDNKLYESYFWTGRYGFDDMNCLDPKKFSVGTHTWKLVFEDRLGYFNTATGTGTFKVIKKDIYHLFLKKAKISKSAKKITVKATLTKNIAYKKVSGKKVKLKFNGKKYTAKTNKKGVATFTIKKKVLKKLKVGDSIEYSVSFSNANVKRVGKVIK